MIKSDWKRLSDLARKIRIDSLIQIHRAKSGHPGGSLSAAEILAFLYASELSYRTDDPSWGERDRFVLSKGHACPALYAAQAAVGLLPDADLTSLRKLGSPLQGHPHVLDLPTVETSTGSLGQGFSVAIGMALGLRHKGIASRVYALLGDGELQEGEVWEGAMFAHHHGLDNICAIVDYNKMQSDDINSNIMTLEPLAGKWSAFGWRVLEINGHDFAEIEAAFDKAKAEKGRPTVIIAHTLKGKGVSFMEGSPAWHGSVCLSDDQLKSALADLEAAAVDGVRR